MTSLSVNQQKAIDKLKRLKVGALFMEPGTGKTRTAIELIRSTDCDYVLFIVPFQTKDNLEKELIRWDFDKRYEIQGVESLSNSDRLYLELRNKLEHANHPFLIVDESLKVKNRQAKRTKRALELGRLSEYRLIMNGTPLARNLLDLWSQMEFLSPKILKMDFNEFKDNFCEYVRYRGINQWGRPSKWQEYIKGFDNVEYLYSLIRPYVFDADLDLNIQKQYIEVKYEVVEGYEEYVEHRESFLNSFMTDPDSYIKLTTLMQQSYCDEPNKIIAIKEIMDNGTLIFVKYLRSKIAILKAYPNANVYTYGKGALGLNLQMFNKIIFFDKTFDYAQRDQSEHRIYRMGQTRPVTYYTLTGDVPLENTIDKNINKKTNLLNEFKNLADRRDEKLWENII